MPIRKLTNPEWEIIEDDSEGLILRFRAPGSRFGTVEIALLLEDAGDLGLAIGQAVSAHDQSGT